MAEEFPRYKVVDHARDFRSNWHKGASSQAEEACMNGSTVIVSRRRFAAIAGGLTAAAIGGVRSTTTAARPNPTPSVELQASVEWFMKQLFEKIASGNPSWIDMVAPEARVGLPETPVSAGIVALPYVGFDLHDELNIRIVYTGFSHEGALSYDELHLTGTSEDDFVVTEWAVRYPHAPTAD